ncbi:peptidase, C25 family [Formosa sp. Hel1_33_131]|uniref:type IX secretion system sortase PorU n=1 Tax=Formosa sp. Hel1_33_131 TaxID=1336794 RepID=UPI0008667D61|nr:type IX secretion system sortase PorU [Formosa sp. Hel1_33_131]AOR28845.1 peptidase, C25 family [Formosa sp. Hel1_33_131]
MTITLRFFTMKRLLPFIALFCFYFGTAQTQSFDINWGGSITLSTGDSSIELPSFDSKYYTFSLKNGITFSAQWNLNGRLDERSAALESVESIEISKTDLKQLPLSSIPNTPSLKVENAVYRDNSKGHVEISPIYYENGVLKKMTRFTISYRMNAQNRRTSSTASISSSNLKSGDWYRFAVDTTGVHKLNRNFLNSLGINTSSINPKNIKIYGHGGKSLPLLNSDTVSNDLIENTIQVVGEEDGVFNDSDYILMYAIGPKKYNSDNNSHVNPYSDKSYYYVNISLGNGARMSTAIEPTGEADVTYNSFHNYKFVESDTYNIAKMGRRWFGHRFYVENVRAFSFDFPNLITSSPVALRVYTAAASESDTSMQLNVNGSEVDNFTYEAIDKDILARADFFSGAVSSSSETINVELSYNNNGNPSATAYLDYISIEAECALTSLGTQFEFKHNGTSTQLGIGQFEISNAATISQVWDISNPYQIQFYTNTDAASEFSFKTSLGTLKTYQAVGPDFYVPRKTNNTNVPNQDIKGTVFLDAQGEFKDIDYLIVAPNYLRAQAERLAQINRTQHNLNVKVYALESIYQEFSSGMQDIGGIRNFVKYVYDNASTPSKKLKYLCLFGDASFDYKDRISNNTNIVPSWYSTESFSLTTSFISDDYFGMMDSNEGTMSNNNILDIAVGRILAENTQRAKEMVDKVESYYMPETYGSWRNNFLLISDDVDDVSDRIIQSTTEIIAEDVKAEKPFMNVKKIHADSYVQETSSGGARYSLVNKAIFDALEVGALVVNYFGHGGEDGLANERIFDKINAQELNNPCKLNCFVTVTCEYTKFDNPLRETAGEYLFWNKKGGAISLITTTRKIYVNAGTAFNKTLSQYLFSYGSDQTLSIGEALRRTKNDPAISSKPQRRLVFNIGDPAIKLPIAKPDIRVTKINDEDVNNSTQVLKALGPAKIEGNVTDAQGTVLNNYNGVLTATIYDKDLQRSTLGNDGVEDAADNLILMNFDALGEVIFRGQASVTNGQFAFEFIVPRDITVTEGNGKISLYSKSEAPLSDNRGYNYDIKIGGVNLNAPEDNIGPTINLYMNDENFVSGGITNEEPTLLANLYDENGINTASGIGHDITGILDGDETNVYKLNDYYVAAIDDYKRGSLSYPLRDLSPGLHTLTLKAWDVYNNASTQDIQFIVFDKDVSLELTNVLNYPNPFVNYTEFWFNHNSSDVLDVSIQIFTVSGKLIKTINGQTNAGSKTTSSVSRDITWDGTDDFGSKIGKGVYVYKLKVRSSSTGMQAEKIEKLVIL